MIAYHLNHNKAYAPSIALEATKIRALTALRNFGAMSRTDLADRIGYSRSTITTVIQELIDLGIVEETGDAESSGGRRARVLNFRPTYGYVVGIDLGATSLDLALANFNNEVIERASMMLDVREGAQTTLHTIRRLMIDIMDKHHLPPECLVAVGLGVPGPVDFQAGMLITPPIMPGWDAYPIRAFFREAFPNAVVTVDNDVNVMALGELRAGAGIDHQNFIFVKVGTGIGCGIVVHGEVYRGADGCAGDIGHICADKNGPVCHCGNVGCLEAIAAGPPIARRAIEAVHAGRSPILSKFYELTDGRLTSVEVSRAAAEGDAIANEIIRESGRTIGEVLASLVNFFNPSLILIGGGVSGIGHQFLSSIRGGILQRSLPLSTRNLRIDTTSMKQDAGVVGALTLALEHVFTVKA
jgi:glucokinase-like ROK family protein